MSEIKVLNQYPFSKEIGDREDMIKSGSVLPLVKKNILLYCELSRLMHDVGGQIAMY